MKKAFKKNNYLFVYSFIVGIINLYLQILPLTNVFGYEFSAVNALILSFLSGLYTISFLKSKQKTEIGIDYIKLSSAFFLMLVLPFTISFVNSIFTGFCSFIDGILFYLVITVPSVIIGCALGFLVNFELKRIRVIAFIILYLIILIISVLEIYFNPQVYLFSPLFAFFPGTIYDEGLVVDFKLILYRLTNKASSTFG